MTFEIVTTRNCNLNCNTVLKVKKKMNSWILK